ncbi:hypothetical protein L3Q82_009292, partial [Scortum barcoo]
MPPTVPPVLSVHPTRALVDEKFRVVVENLPPASPVTLHSLHLSEDKDYWEAYGHYISDHRGSVAVAEDLSFGGTYTGKEPMGLLWSVRPVPGSRKGLRLRKMDVCSPMLVNISVYGGHVAEGFMEQPPLASVLTERWYMAPGVQRIDIKEEEVIGTLFIPPGPGPFPGLLDMWGGGGGLVEYRASLLASHGYVSFALQYCPAGELQSAHLGLNYFEVCTAFNIIQDHPQVIRDRVGVFGLSLGSILTINLAARSTIVKAKADLMCHHFVLQPRCCVCVSGNHSNLTGMTLKGFPQKFATDTHKIRLDENKCQILRDVCLAITTDPSMTLDVGKINCPMMLVNGNDDQSWPTDVSAAKDMARMMQAAGKEHLLTIVQYPDTGHLIEPPYSPHTRASRFVMDDTKGKGEKKMQAITCLVRRVKSQPRTTKKQICQELEGARTQVSVSTVKRVLHRHGLRGCHARRKPFLQKRHLKARLKFAADHMDKDKTFWRKVLWSDETKIELSGHNAQQYVWRRKGETFYPKNTMPTVTVSTVVVVLCCGAVLLPMELVLYR